MIHHKYARLEYIYLNIDLRREVTKTGSIASEVVHKIT